MTPSPAIRPAVQRGQPAADDGGRRMLGLCLAFVAQTLWGCYPGLTRYLQVDSDIGTLSLLSVSSAVVLPILVVLVQRAEGLRSLSKMKAWFVFAVLVVLRSLTNMFSTRFTLSIYVQLINTSTPFFVTLFNYALLKEPLPQFTLPALLVSLLGSFLALFSPLLESSEALTSDDAIGLSLAFLSSAALGGYFVFVRTVDSGLSRESVLFVQLLCVLVVSLPASFAVDASQWSRWADLSASDWLVFAIFTMVVWLGANVSQIQSIRLVGAPTVSCVMPWRLVPASVMGVLLLDESLDALQFIGCSLVLLSVSAYLYTRYRHRLPVAAKDVNSSEKHPLAQTNSKSTVQMTMTTSSSFESALDLPVSPA